MKFELSKSTVRSWRWDDRESLVRHANDKEVSINLRDRFPYPYSHSDARAWLEYAVDREPETNFAICVDDEAVGGIGFILESDVGYRSAEIGYWLGKDYWGRGISSEALIAVTEYAFENFDLCRLYAHVFEWNHASARVLEKAGYSQEGRLRKSVTKDGRTIDQFLYAIIRE